jgi:hypothetical protein
MRIVNAELLVPTAEEIQNLVQKAYDAGYIRGREEAKRALQGFAKSRDGAGIEAGEARIAVATVNEIAKNGFAHDVKRLLRDLAELKEMVRPAARISGDEQTIVMIKGLLARWQKITSVITLHAVESHLQTRH